MGDVGAAAFSDMLLVNGTLISLNLANNRITNEGAYTISHALEKNVTLKKLMLDHNKIGYGVCLCLTQTDINPLTLSAVWFLHTLVLLILQMVGEQ
jgi:hypothetical protein